MSATTERDTIAPADEAGIAAAIAEASAERLPLLIRGNGSKAGMLRPVQAARSLSTCNHRGVTLYAPKELVLSARAGTPLVDIEATLTEAGQHLIAEPPDLAFLTAGATQTLGGIVATNLSGPRRVAWGAMRDHVLGIRAVNGTGALFHSGGRVLKNVTGLDLCKLMAGSHGTLGVLTEITLKVLPAPESVGTVLLAGLDAKAGVAALAAALGSPYGVSGAAWLPADAAASVPELATFGASATLIRIEDFTSSVVYRADRLRDALAAWGAAEILDVAASRAIWRAVRDAAPLGVAPSDAVWRVSVRPSAGPDVLGSVMAAMQARCFLDWGGGLVWIAGTGNGAAHDTVRQAARAAGGTWTLMRGPETLRAAVDVIPPVPAPLDHIGRRLKAVLDPSGILNPGRMYAGQ